MSDIIELLQTARQEGLTVTTDGHKLFIQGRRGADEIARELIARKSEIIPTLWRKSSPKVEAVKAQPEFPIHIREGSIDRWIFVPITHPLANFRWADDPNREDVIPSTTDLQSPPIKRTRRNRR